MAESSENLIAESMMNSINKHNYCKYVHYLGIEEGYSRKEFWKSDLPNKYWLNFKDKTIDNDHVYNIFGVLSKSSICCYTNEVNKCCYVA